MCFMILLFFSTPPLLFQDQLQFLFWLLKKKRKMAYLFVWFRNGMPNQFQVLSEPCPTYRGRSSSHAPSELPDVFLGPFAFEGAAPHYWQNRALLLEHFHAGLFDDREITLHHREELQHNIPNSPSNSIRQHVCLSGPIVFRVGNLRKLLPAERP